MNLDGLLIICGGELSAVIDWLMLSVCEAGGSGREELNTLHFPLLS